MHSAVYFLVLVFAVAQVALQSPIWCRSDGKEYKSMKEFYLSSCKPGNPDFNNIYRYKSTKECELIPRAPPVHKPIVCFYNGTSNTMRTGQACERYLAVFQLAEEALRAGGRVEDIPFDEWRRLSEEGTIVHNGRCDRKCSVGKVCTVEKRKTGGKICDEYDKVYENRCQFDVEWCKRLFAGVAAGNKNYLGRLLKCPKVKKSRDFHQQDTIVSK